MQFYILESDSPTPWITCVHYKHTNCPGCGKRPVGRVGSIAVRFKSKKQMNDFSLTSEGIIVRAGVTDLLTEMRLTGWRSGHLNVEASPKLKNEVLNYVELIVVGRTQSYSDYVALDLKREPCPICGRKAYSPPDQGIFIPLETWDGSDIFCIYELPGLVIVTEDFHDHIIDQGYTGTELIPIEEWSNPLNY